MFRVMKSWKSGAIPNAQKKKLGRPNKTTTEQDAFIVDAVENNRKMVPRLVQRMLLEIYGVRLLLSHIRYRLQIAGLDGHICVRKPLLSDINKAKRLLWAYRHRNWTYEQWKKVLWSTKRNLSCLILNDDSTAEEEKGKHCECLHCSTVGDQQCFGGALRGKTLEIYSKLME